MAVLTALSSSRPTVTPTKAPEFSNNRTERQGAYCSARTLSMSSTAQQQRL